MDALKKKYVKRIKKALELSDLYAENLSIQIENLASTLVVLHKCEEEINAPDFKVTVMKITRDGEQPVEAPVLKAHARLLSQVTIQMKALSLTVDEIKGMSKDRKEREEHQENEESPLTILLKEVNKN